MCLYALVPRCRPSTCGAVVLSGWGTRSWNSGRCDIACVVAPWGPVRALTTASAVTRRLRPCLYSLCIRRRRACLRHLRRLRRLRRLCRSAAPDRAFTASASAAAEHASLGFGFELGFGLVTMPLPPLKRRLQRILKPHSSLDLTRSHSICAVPTQRSWSFSRLILRLNKLRLVPRLAMTARASPDKRRTRKDMPPPGLSLSSSRRPSGSRVLSLR